MPFEPPLTSIGYFSQNTIEGNHFHSVILLRTSFEPGRKSSFNEKSWRWSKEPYPWPTNYRPSSCVLTIFRPFVRSHLNHKDGTTDSLLYFLCCHPYNAVGTTIMNEWLTKIISSIFHHVTLIFYISFNTVTINFDNKKCSY